MKFFNTCFFILIFFCENFYAVSNSYNNFLIKSCPIQNDIINNYEPEEFLTTNNLFINPISKHPQKILIYGKIKTKEGNPVKDAKIFLWQVNAEGFYNYKALKSKVDQKLFHKSEYFLGNGISTSDNLGNFHFISVYPDRIHELLPHINLRIEGENLRQSRVILPKCQILYDTSLIKQIPHELLNYNASSERTEIFYLEILIN